MNSIKCKDCRFFLQRKVVKGQSTRPSWNGYCVKQSSGVPDNWELDPSPKIEKPFIVDANGVVTLCPHASKR